MTVPSQPSAALTALRPLHAGVDLLAPERSRAFGSRAELASAEKRLDALAEALR